MGLHQTPRGRPEAHAPPACPCTRCIHLVCLPYRGLPQKLFELMWVCVSSPKHKTWHTALCVLKCLSTLPLFMGTGTPEEQQPCAWMTGGNGSFLKSVLWHLLRSSSLTFGFLSPTDTWQSQCLVIEPPKKSPSVRNLYNGISGALSGKQLKKNQSHNKTFRPAYLAPLCPWCPHTHSCPLSGLSWAELLSILPGLPLPPWGPATQVSSRKCQKTQKC